jgi:hypothetical protein
MAQVRQAILARRAWPLFRWNLIGFAPPLTLTGGELAEGLAAVDAGLEAGDRALA